MTTLNKEQRWKAKQRANGLCIKCTKPVTTYACYCNKHAQQNRERMRAWLDSKRDEEQLTKLRQRRKARAVRINN